MEVEGMRKAIMSVRALALLLLIGVASAALGTAPAQAQETEQECEIQGTEASSRAEQALNEGLEAEDEAEARQRFEQALATADQELENNPDNPPPAALWIAGRAELRLGNYARADSLLTRFETAKPGCGQFTAQVRRQVWAELFNEAIEAYQAGDQQGALDKFDQANLVWDDPRSLENAAVLHQNQGDLAKAEELFRRTIEVAADTSERRNTAVASLARVLEARGKDQEAMQLYEDYLAENPGAVEMKVNYAATLISQGNQDEARQIYSDLLGQEDLSFDILSSVGLGLLQLGSNEEAMQALRRARQIQPYGKSAMVNMFQATLGAGQLERAVALGDTLLDWFPYEKQTYTSMAQALDRLGRTGRVQEILAAQQGLPMEFLQVQMNTRGSNIYVVQGSVSGQASAGQEVTVNFEFLSGSGDVVAEKDVAIQLPPQGQTQVFQTSVQTDEEVAGFRYGRAGS